MQQKYFKLYRNKKGKELVFAHFEIDTSFFFFKSAFKSIWKFHIYLYFLIKKKLKSAEVSQITPFLIFSAWLVYETQVLSLLGEWLQIII